MLWTRNSRTLRLRGARRRSALRQVMAATAGLQWTHGFLKLLLEELCVDDEIAYFVGHIDRLPLHRVPHVLAVAIAMRHSWRTDDLATMARQLTSVGRRHSERLSRDHVAPRQAS
jgi:hypothetical protein